MQKQNEELRKIVNDFHELNLRLSAWREKYEKREVLVSFTPADESIAENYKFEELTKASIIPFSEE